MFRRPLPPTKAEPESLGPSNCRGAIASPMPQLQGSELYLSSPSAPLTAEGATSCSDYWPLYVASKRNSGDSRRVRARNATKRESLSVS